MDQRPKTIKLLEENIRVNFHDLGLSQWFLKYNTKNLSDERKNKVDFIKIENLVLAKIYWEMEKTTHRMGKNTDKSYIW